MANITRNCKDCKQPFHPKTGAQYWCPRCKQKRIDKQPKERKQDPMRGLGEHATRANRVSPVTALEIEARLRRRGIRT